ncbi:MAG: VWA domain-containing protein [Vicinamibacteria bacterium]|nr:VWA domain-containing protein [Vicinamibacteria bacterium]
MLTRRQALLSLGMLAGSRGMLAQAPAQRFESSIEIVTVTVAVTDLEGRLVTDLAQDEFEVFEDGLPQTITQFTRERVPVSLAVLLDVSDSMVGLRLADARQALDRFLFELLARDDEYSLVVFNHQPTIAAQWTDDPAKVTPALDALRGWGGTAIYDAVNASLPLLDKRHRQRGAAVVISDGADTASDIQIRDLRSRLLRTDAFVYAIGIDRDDPRALRTRINPYSLRQVTDDTGGYTEVVKETSELGAATSRIADELNKQYTLGYTPAHANDSQFHGIRVRVKRTGHRVRARRGYIATPDRRRR